MLCCTPYLLRVLPHQLTCKQTDKGVSKCLISSRLDRKKGAPAHELSKCLILSDTCGVDADWSTLLPITLLTEVAPLFEASGMRLSVLIAKVVDLSVVELIGNNMANPSCADSSSNVLAVTATAGSAVGMKSADDRRITTHE